MSRAAATRRAEEVQALKHEILRLRTVLETIRDLSGIEAAGSTNPVTASFLAFLSGKTREALEES